MLFSAFTPLGLYELSNEEPLAERIYASAVAAHGGQYDMTVGESRQEAWCYMTALRTARAMKAQERAARQALPSEVNELMPVREEEFEITPAWNATFLERRAELERRTERPGTWTKARIVERLQELLGDDFIAYRPTPLTDATRWPVTLGDSPGNFQPPTVTRKLARLTQPVSVGLGAPQSVTYELVNTPHGPNPPGDIDLSVGDSLVVEPEIFGITETVTITAKTGANITATFELPHTNGCLCSTAPYPKQITTKRHNLVIVTPAAAIDAAKRKLVDDNMRRMVRGSSTWDIVDSADGLETGEFEIGVSFIGSHTITSGVI